mmetsp:Transcript_20748/g.45136  ORF Transcript_20748/g.45136 Transcript_20748/m.45136 type:complete len:322 (+) Transcript_20748:56-1021(+)
MRPSFNGGAPWRRPEERRRRNAEFFSCAQAPRPCRRGASGSASRAAAFVWAEGEPVRPAAEIALPHGLLVQTAAAFAGDGLAAGLSTAAVPGVAAACLPLWALPSSPPAAARGAGGEGPPPGAAAQLTSRVRHLQQALVAACAAQASAATVDLAFNDPLSGLIGFGIATLGWQASSPQGYRYLPSYIVLTFCNGTMQVLMGLELAAARHAMWQHMAAPLSVKLLAGGVSLVSPVLMFAGLAVAWHLHCDLRALTLQAGPGGLLPAAGTDAVVPGAGEGAGGESSATAPLGGFLPFHGQAHRLDKDEAAKAKASEAKANEAK